jgi:hypothetical protein
MLRRLLVAFWLSLLVGACTSPQTTQSPAATAAPIATPAEVHIRTADTEATDCAFGQLGGTLVLDAVSRLGLSLSSGRTIEPWWPGGWSARQDGASVALLDPSGSVVAHVGDRLRTSAEIRNNSDVFVCSGGVGNIARPRPSATT